MELNDFKETWKNENNKILNRLEINENRLNEITVQNSKNKYDKFISISIIGRNLALLYFIISIWFASKAFNDVFYSIPAIIGGFAMLFSFFQHITLKRANYNTMSIIELQKTIQRFRIHTSKYAKFDKGIVALWFLTISPIYLKLYFRISIFSNPNHFFIFILIIVSCVLLLKIFPFDIYKKWDIELNEAETKLNEILNYEKE
ncbi:hypothetical protein [Tenacibaculum sp. SG-28]|uniref:hypothetical protein n=1 Tax=Tenacibaculum sp. SG-28 TaxID=754426 RepID=UPI000CF418F7|nr:hypothetical protein [Tenacibaculum sp. SG-28]PQJ22750.1 hypothetical protein BSU00_00025 [Tenacibaculum sp. SG-28]